MTAVILVFVLVATVLWVLLTPVIVIVDSTRRELKVAQRGTFAVSWTVDRPIELRICGILFSLKPHPAKPKKVTKKAQGRTRSMDSWLYLLRGLLKSIGVRKLILKVDTDDVVLNAQLIPAAVLLSHNDLAFNINYQGEVSLYAMIEIKLNRLIWTYMVFLTKT
jgi:hypothetical protein